MTELEVLHTQPCALCLNVKAISKKAIKLWLRIVHKQFSCSSFLRKEQNKLENMWCCFFFQCFFFLLWYVASYKSKQFITHFVKTKVTLQLVFGTVMHLHQVNMAVPEG